MFDYNRSSSCAVQLKSESGDSVQDAPGSSRGRVLIEAHENINNVKMDQYGRPEDAFADIAHLWSWYLQTNITPYQVAFMMTLLKLSRQRHQHQHDNLLDAAGYIALASELLP